MANVTRRTFLNAGAAAALLSLNGQALAKATTEHGFNDAEIKWLSLEGGIKSAAADRKPIFLVVHATWCPVCTEYKELFGNKRVVKSLTETFVPVLIDVDEQEELQAKYAPDGDYVPRSMVLDSDGVHLEEVKLNEDKYVYFLPPDKVNSLQAFLLDGAVRHRLHERKRAASKPAVGGLKLSLD